MGEGYQVQSLPMQPNTLYYGDNLEILRRYLPDECVDLIYLDPPFNSNCDYNLLFKEQSGEPAQAQIKAFTDTWQWSERAFVEFCETCPKPQLVELVQGFVKTPGFFGSLEEPTAPMVQEAERAGYYTSPLGNRKIPRLQIRTVGQLLGGEELRWMGVGISIVGGLSRGFGSGSVLPTALICPLPSFCPLP